MLALSLHGPDTIGPGHHRLGLQGLFLKGRRHLRQHHPNKVAFQIPFHPAGITLEPDDPMAFRFRHHGHRLRDDLDLGILPVGHDTHIQQQSRHQDPHDPSKIHILPNVLHSISSRTHLTKDHPWILLNPVFSLEMRPILWYYFHK